MQPRGDMSSTSASRLTAANLATFWSRVEKTPTCWLWARGKSAGGYGSISLGGVQYFAHRLAFEDAFGPIPERMSVESTCKNRACVNPDHLRLATKKENNENTIPRTDKTSMYKGVSFHKASQKWIVYVKHNNKQYYLGLFNSEAAAGEAARLKRLELFTHNDLDKVA